MIQNGVYIYIPMIIIFTGNLTIILKLNIISKTRMEITSNTEVVERRYRECKQMSRLLIVVACSFIVLHIPQILARIGEAIYSNPKHTFQNNQRGYSVLYLLVSLGYQLTDFQNSINFFLYCAFGTKVRMALIQLLVCKRNTS